MDQKNSEFRETQIDVILKSAKGNPVDVCLELIRLMDGLENPCRLLKVILEYSLPIGDLENDHPVNTSSETIDEFVRMNFRYIVHYTRLLARKNMPQEDFYKSLYEELFVPGNGLLPDSDISRALTLEILANHVRCVPYYQLPVEKDFSNDEFEKAVNNLNGSLQVANHILQRDFSTKTEEGIQFFRLMETIPEKRDQIVFLSVLLGMVRIDATRENE